jgi:hypothetical protein
MSSQTAPPPAIWSTRAKLWSATSALLPAIELLVLIIAFEILILNAWTIASSPRINADSGTALAISRSLADGNTEPPINTLSPPLQTGTYAGLLIIGEIEAISAVPAILSIGLALVLASLVRNATRSTIAAAAPLFLLLFSGVFWEQTGLLTFYPAFAILGYGGLYFAGLFLLRDSPRVADAVFAGLLISLALYAFTTALLFLPIPALLVICYLTRERLLRGAVLYGITGVFAAPWFVWHVLVGGKHFYYHPLNWSTEEMLPIVNREFWQYPRESLTEYAGTMLHVGFDGLLVAPLWGLVPIGLFYTWRMFGGRAVAFVLMSSVFFLATLAFVRPSPFVRYYYPIFPLVILLASLGAYAIWHQLTSGVGPRFAALTLVLALAMTALVSPLTLSVPAKYQYKYAERLHTSSSYRDMSRIAGIIDDKRGVVGRDSAIQVLIPKNQTHTVFLISEEDYVTYLSWPSDEAALAVLDKYGIGWLLLYKDAERWERDYNVWLQRVYGIPPRHYLAIESAQGIEKVYDGRIYALYKVLDQEPTWK